MQIELQAANSAIKKWLRAPCPGQRHLAKQLSVLSALRLVRTHNPTMYAKYRTELSSDEVEMIEYTKEGVRLPPAVSSGKD